MGATIVDLQASITTTTFFSLTRYGAFDCCFIMCFVLAFLSLPALQMFKTSFPLGLQDTSAPLLRYLHHLLTTHQAYITTGPIRDFHVSRAYPTSD